MTFAATVGYTIVRINVCKRFLIFFYKNAVYENKGNCYKKIILLPIK